MGNAGVQLAPLQGTFTLLKFLAGVFRNPQASRRNRISGNRTAQIGRRGSRIGFEVDG